MAKAAVLNLYDDTEKGDLIEWLDAHDGDEGWPAGCKDAAVWLTMVKPGQIEVPRTYLEAITFAYYDWLEILESDEEPKDFMTKLIEYDDEFSSEDDDEEVEVLCEEDAQVEQELSDEESKFKVAKETICRILEGLNIARVDFEYSGSGKNETVDCCVMKDHQLCEQPWKDFKDVVVELDGKPETLRDALAAFCFEVVEIKHTSWHYEDGGFGSVVIDVPDRKITLDHNEYVMTTNNSVDYL